MSKGFTLVEMLVVISILSIFGVLTLTIFTRTLQGGNKSQIIGVIKQTGQAVLESMDKLVRNADNIVCPKISSSEPLAISDTLVVIKNGLYTRFRFFAPNSTSNGYIQEDFPTQPTSGDEASLNIFLNNVCTDPMGTDSPTPQTLTDTDTKIGTSVQISPAAGAFITRKKQAGSKDTVTISFDLAHGIVASPSIAGQIDAVTFQTSI